MSALSRAGGHDEPRIPAAGWAAGLSGSLAAAHRPRAHALCTARRRWLPGVRARRRRHRRDSSHILGGRRVSGVTDADARAITALG